MFEGKEMGNIGEFQSVSVLILVWVPPHFSLGTPLKDPKCSKMLI